MLRNLTTLIEQAPPDNRSLPEDVVVWQQTACHWPRRLLAMLLLAVGLPTFADVAALAGSIEVTVGGKTLQFPSLASAIDVDLRGDLARVRVTQTFENPLTEPVHARYLFPLNKDAAVFALTMNIGNERVRAIIKEKVAAEKTFKAAKQAGKAAVLLTQHRPNMFSQRIANLIPGQPIEVIMEYTQVVPKIDSAYELVVPLVVGPRFDPGVGTAEVAGAALSASLSELASLPAANPVAGVHVPQTVASDRVAVSVRLESPVGFTAVTSATHELTISQPSGAVIQASLAATTVVPNRDFVLRYRLGAETGVAAGMLGYADDKSGYFSLLIEPPQNWQEELILPREMVFLLDCSGSMSGAPLSASKAFMRAALTNLRPQDSFRIIRFSDHATEFSRSPLMATPSNIAAGLRYTNALKGSGGTVMRSGVEQALMVPQSAGSVRNVVFLTDGYIGNEFEILGLVERELGAARLFALGVGSGVNRFLLDELARTGRGFARYLDPTANVAKRAVELAERLQTPLLTDLAIDWGEVGPADVTPSRLPDLYAGDSLRLQGRYATPGQYRINVRGRSGGARVELPIDVTLPAAGEGDGAAIALVWARSAIKDAMHQLSVPRQLRIAEMTDETIKQRVTELGLGHSLVTQWTSFVAVSEEIYNAAPETTKEAAVPGTKVAGVSKLAHPTATTANVPHGGYAAPEPATWLGMALLLLLLMVSWWRRPEAIPAT